MRDKQMQKFLGLHTGFARGIISGNKPENRIKLFSILEHGEHLKKYFLSPKACLGIIRRSNGRGKTIPARLLAALESRLVGHEPGQPNDTFATLMASGAGVSRPAGMGSELDFLVLEKESSESVTAFVQNQRDEVREMEVVGALAVYRGAKQQSYIHEHEKHVVRRVTPKECERLQGFPDDWTRIPFGGKMPENCSDAPRYKACGNSFAVPVIKWIGQRILLNIKSSLE